MNTVVVLKVHSTHIVYQRTTINNHLQWKYREIHSLTRVRELDIPDCPPRDGGGEGILTRPGLPRGSGRGEICRGEVGEDSARQGVHSVSSVVSVWIIMSVCICMYMYMCCVTYMSRVIGVRWTLKVY